MKREAKTEEEKQGLKELKEQWKKEIRETRSELKADGKLDREAWKSLKRSGKGDKKARLVARHVEDVTIPDGTELPPNTPFIKTWKIRNEGPAWPTGSQLLFVSHKGDNLNGPERVIIKGEVLPGQEVEVSVPLITPNESGRYVGYYRMVTPDGVKFGQRVWVSFVVKREGDPPTVIPSPLQQQQQQQSPQQQQQEQDQQATMRQILTRMQQYQQPAHNDLARMCDNVDL